MLNIGTMKPRTNEAFKNQLKRRTDICCVQETTWKSSSTWTIAGVKIVYIILCVQHNAVVSVVGLLATCWIKNWIPVNGPTHFQEQVKKF